LGDSIPPILIDSEIPADNLRERIYAGDLIILTRLRVPHDFVSYMREELTALFAPHDPEHAHEFIEPAAGQRTASQRILDKRASYHRGPLNGRVHGWVTASRVGESRTVGGG
jgi:hypothetical protein